MVNDLTQMTYGFSRDDAGKFLNAYYDTKIFENDPFAKLDQNGVGKLMDMAIKLGKPVNPKLHVGICGEHGGDPSSVEFLPSLYFFPCGRLGINDSFGGDSIAISITSYGRAACLCDKLFGFGIGLVGDVRHCDRLWGLGRLCCE